MIMSDEKLIRKAAFFIIAKLEIERLIMCGGYTRNNMWSSRSIFNIGAIQIIWTPSVNLRSNGTV